MASGPLNQNGQGTAVERCLRAAWEQYAFVRCHSAFVARVRPFGTSGLPVPERRDPYGPASRSHRGYSSDYSQGSSRNCSSSSRLCEDQRANHRFHRDTGIDHVSEHSEKTWLSRAQRPASFRFTLSICLTVCTIPKSLRPIIFWSPFGSALSAAV